MPGRRFGETPADVALVAATFRYEPSSGTVLRIDSRSTKPVRKKARVGARTVRVHVLVWLLCKGAIPVGFEIDHADRDDSNNRVENLRLATGSENQRNRGAQRNNTTGFKGVSFDRRTKRYSASIAVHGRQIWLGRFDSKQAAARAYQDAARLHHGEFACHA
jgi:hypothetical protein